jgi:hypothetical protein
MVAGMVAFGGSYGTDYVLFSFITCHDNKIPAIKFLIAEVDDFRVAPIMLP